MNSTVKLQNNIVVNSLSHTNSSVTPRTTDSQAPLSMGFFKQEYWSELSLTSPGDLPDPGINPHLLLGRWILYH